MGHTFTTSDDGHVTGTGPTVEDDWFLDPRDQKVCPLPNYSILDPSKPVKDHRPVPCVHWNTHAGTTSTSSLMLSV